MNYSELAYAPGNLNKPTCLVTGASSGIGKCIVAEMVNREWRVIAVARRKEKLIELAGEFDEGSAIPVVCDVGDESQILQVSKSLKQQGAAPSLFFLNAGSGDIEHDDRFDYDLHRRTFDVNYFGTVAWIDQWLPVLKKSGGGTFVATSSLQSLFPTPEAAAYGASKSALNYCFRSLDALYRKDDIRFTLVYPGPVATDMLKTEDDAKMPFTWTAERAAAHIVRKTLRGAASIKSGSGEMRSGNLCVHAAARIRFPLPWSLLLRFMNFLPESLSARLVRAKKPLSALSMQSREVGK